MSPGLGWDFFDAIYCISLKSRPDRMEAAKKQFALVGLEDRVEFLVVLRDEEIPARGIFGSHQRCLTLGLTMGARHILIFEDDVFFRNYNHTQLQNACRFLERIGTWDAFFLGGLTNGSQKTGGANIAKIQYRCLAHAYALHCSFAQHVVQQPWQGIPFDDLLRCHGTHCYALKPMCAFQGRATSDNKTVLIARLRTLLGGLAFIQRGNEWFQNHKKLIIAIHILIVFLAVIVLIWPRS